MRTIHRPHRTVGGSVLRKGLTLIPLLVVAASTVDVAAQEPEPIEVSETVTVTDRRLRDRPESELETPAHVTILESEEIASGGAQTLQELLAGEAGVVLFDQVGDDVAKTFDLRGFGGTGTKVFLNGMPLNEPRNNSLALELVPLAQLERIEIVRGSTAALAGGGSEGGVVNLWTRRPETLEGALSAAAGDFSSLDVGARLSNRFERTDLSVSGSLFETDGFRDNADGDLSRAALDLGWEWSAERRFDLSLTRAESDFGNPGALTIEEERRDRERSPFNALDGTDQGLSQATLNYTSVPARSWSLSANLYAREGDAEVLTTGRAAPSFGGFFLDSDTSVVGSTVQASRDAARHHASLGVEWLDGETEAIGIGTPSTDPGRVDPSLLASDNVADRETLALFAQDRWRLSERLTLTLGARYDRDDVAYRESFPDPVNAGSREFSELSLRAGGAWRLGDRHSVYASFGEAFLPPTVEQLFSFPLFGSNPDLEPQDSRTVEAGFRGRWSGNRLDLAVFRTETEDEIVFDPDSPLGLFGANVNIGEASRNGLELSWRGDWTDSIRGFANLTVMDAEFANGPNDGNRLPLVPDERLSAGVEADLPRGFALRAIALYVGEQVLDNDDANGAPELDAYTVLNARLSWAPGGDGAITLFIDARNLFDERYATRGIFAFDFQTFTNEVFVTPAPGRRVMGGLEWSF